MKKDADDIYALHNFEFLAITFAQMAAQGRAVDIGAVTGNMDEEHRAWFTERYRYWLAVSGQAPKERCMEETET
ncbi:glycogen synthase [Salmonella enterica subsp. enterica serovar Chester]|nr:glycogen synthase [Salmonella enterica subsp. enterica serovar Chester]